MEASKGMRSCRPGGYSDIEDMLQFSVRGRFPGTAEETSMKKQAKKLVLAKETVGSLDLKNVSGQLQNSLYCTSGSAYCTGGSMDAICLTSNDSLRC